MKILTRIRRATVKLTLHYFKTLAGLIAPRVKTEKGTIEQAYTFLYDDGFIRLTHLVKFGTEWGLRFKPFPFEGFKISITNFQGIGDGLKVYVTVPFILSIGFLYAPKTSRLLRYVRLGLKVNVDLRYIELKTIQHFKEDEVTNLIDLPLVKDSGVQYGRFIVTALFGNVTLTYRHRYYLHRWALFPFITRCTDFVTVEDQNGHSSLNVVKSSMIDVVDEELITAFSEYREVPLSESNEILSFLIISSIVKRDKDNCDIPGHWDFQIKECKLWKKQK